MADTLKELIYNKFADVLEEKGLIYGINIERGYDCMYFQDGTPAAVNTSDLSVFLYEKVETVPFSEITSDETPSVNTSDRSEFNFQYMLTFKLDVVEEVKQTLMDYREYFFTNPHHELGGYNVVFKTVRGNKIGSWGIEAGNLMGGYQIGVYCTASKGYLTKPTDGWYIKNLTTEETSYTKLPLLDETCGYVGSTNPSTANSNITYKVSNHGLTKKYNIYYDSSTLAQEIMELITLGGTSDKYEVYESFNEVDKTAQQVIIADAQRTIKPNAPVIISFTLLSNDEDV